MEPERSRIELFDMIWWTHFRQVEPAGQPRSSLRPAPPADWPVSATADGVKANVLIFCGNDEPYLRWISENPGGYVVNAERQLKPSCLKLHRATCIQISRRARPGAYTERDYIKICSLGRSVLERWARDEVGGLIDALCACL